MKKTVLVHQTFSARGEIAAILQVAFVLVAVLLLPIVHHLVQLISPRANALLQQQRVGIQTKFVKNLIKSARIGKRLITKQLVNVFLSSHQNLNLLYNDYLIV